MPDPAKRPQVDSEVRRAGRHWAPFGAAVSAIGLVCVLIGSFLPWLVSGGVRRDSYAIVGIVGRLGLAGSGFAATALSFWPLLGPVVMLPVIAAILRRWRIAAVTAMLIGLITGLTSGGVLIVASGHRAMGIGVENQGPVCTAIGAAAAILGALVLLIRAPTRRPPAPGRARTQGRTRTEGRTRAEGRARAQDTAVTMTTAHQSGLGQPSNVDAGDGPPSHHRWTPEAVDVPREPPAESPRRISGFEGTSAVPPDNTPVVDVASSAALRRQPESRNLSPGSPTAHAVFQKQ